MSKKIVSLFLALLMLFSMANALAEDSAISVTDMFGREITLAQPATRIVALSAAECEILCALGCEDALVGRGEYCDYPASILDVPVVQSGANTNLEEILVLDPQVVIMSDMAQSKEQVEALERNGVKVVISNANSLAEVYASMELIGKLMGKTAEAQAMIADMQSTLADLAARCENTGKTVFFEVSPLQWGLWAAGKNTFMDEIAAICGLNNIFADVDGWGAVSEEQVLARDPDYIVTITMYYGEGPTPVEEILSRTGWAEVKAVANGSVFQADADMISRPGPRLKDAALALAEFIESTNP